MTRDGTNTIEDFHVGQVVEYTPALEASGRGVVIGFSPTHLMIRERGDLFTIDPLDVNRIVPPSELREARTATG